MSTIHDDFPHPVPPMAFLRYKENYFFVVMGKEEGVYAGLHFNNEPGFGRTKLHFDLLIKGKRVTYHNVVPISPRFGQEPIVSDGIGTMTIHESHKLFSIVLKTDDLELDLRFDARLPTFDFHACRYAAPDVPSFQDVSTHGLNLPLEHIEQSMMVSGTVRTGDSGPITLNCLGYRDHSWGMRADNTTAWHTWSVINFQDRSFAIMSQAMLTRRGLLAREGCVVDAAGPRALRSVEAKPVDFVAGSVLPSRMLYDVTDMLGERYQLEADVAGCLGQVGLKVEEPAHGQIPFTVTENFCSIKDLKSGEVGIGLVELGYNPQWEKPFVQTI